MVVAVMVAAGGARGTLVAPQGSYNILMLLPMSTRSHRNVFLPLAEALADRGHKVVMLTNQPPTATHENITEVYHGLPNILQYGANMFSRRSSATAFVNKFGESVVEMSRSIYQVPAVMDLYSRRKEFHLIIINMLYCELMYPFVHEATFITVCPTALSPRHSAVMGNPLSPAAAPSTYSHFSHPMSLLDKIKSFGEQSFRNFYWTYWAVIPAIQKEIAAQFPHLPPLLEVERNQSLTLINSHFTIDTPVPLLPSQVEVGGLHCRPGRPLPQRLEAWVTGAGEGGVVYFSLGSVTNGTLLPVTYRDMFVDAFRQVEQRVIWKFEEKLMEVSENVLMDTWLPQQDILADPRVKLFISHGGLLSSEEAVFHATPVLALPMSFDQPKTSGLLQDLGVARVLHWEQLSTQLIVNSIKEIINNPRYTTKAQELSRMFRDRPETAGEKAVFWTEYVIRHQGGGSLRSPAARLSWREFLMLDVLVGCLLAAGGACLIMRALLRPMFTGLFYRGTGKVKRE
nr:UDP-glycosyltransferase UGT5-like [Procambarus clarkii]